MAFKNNSPSLSYVSWDKITIIYNDESYIISNYYTNKKFIYWNYLTPYQFDSSDLLLEEIAGRYLVAINDKGVCSEIYQTDIVVGSSEINSDFINEKIFGIVEQTKEHGERFTAIETDINGIRQTVGSYKEDVDGVKQSITVLEQKDNELTLKAESLERELANDKYYDDLREKLNKSIIDFNSILGAYSSEMESYMKDMKISEDERVFITDFQTRLNTAKIEIINHVDSVLTMLDQNGETGNYNLLDAEKSKFNSAFNALKTIVDNATTDNLFVPSEVTSIVSAFASLTTRGSVLKNTIDDMLFLGAGGSVIDELAKISVQSNNITLSVEKIESTIRNNLNLIKSNLQSHIDDLNRSLTNLNKCLSRVFEDRNITTLEKEDIAEKITDLNNELDDIKTKYEEIIADVDITEETKASLIQSFEEYLTVKDNMETIINNSIENDIVDDIEINNITNAINDFNNYTSKFHNELSKALDEIENNNWNRELSEAKAEFSTEINEISDRLDSMTVDINESMNSGLIDEIEKQTMLSNLSVLAKEKETIDAKFNNWYNDKFLYGDDKTNYKTTYDNLVKEYNQLVTLINSIANSDKLVSETDKKNVDTKLKDFYTSLGNFYYESDRVINTISRNETEYNKTNIHNEIKDVNNAISSLEDTMNESFKDSIISESEILNLKNILTQTEKEMKDINTRYDELYSNPNLK